ncbi:MAG TPA: multifunctional oxoglutarate decarboxylase/oxoglutarate dehydrogenase thiamine pyrophosphate-binding subunit/dihydrolipoyllysine-residue succinyltransferase subunit [Acidimicrobiales bacterium]|nr:multifunctional oxoglutarate decarboxylase/oxoglutarate dehydrogenase thiamine pyrophosphate-binding subunit/dihydrolipoyllysine-residue succinyltransferase subunit [Acidimicrobiales bacterium]
MANDTMRDGAAGAYGPNAWLVEEMYEAYLADPNSVSESWQEFFADYRSLAHPSGAEAIPAPSGGGAAERPSSSPLAPTAPPPAPASAPVAVSAAGATVAPAPSAGVGADGGGVISPEEEKPTPLRGAAARVVENMTASLSVPTATSVHPVPAKLLEVNRQIINNQLGRTTGGKVSFTHIIGWAVVRALQAVPALNSSFVADADGSGTPGVVRHEHVGLGLAVDSERSDGSRTLVVPCVKRADELDFAGFVHAYEELVRKVRTNKLAVEDFAGTTVTITNPGTLGTTQSVPRLMPGQGAIIGVGSLAYPPEFAAADPAALAELGVSKVVALTSTYDHRVIQGAESGLFLSRVHELLVGEHGFYDELFDSLHVPYQPARWHQDVNPFAGADGERGRLVKQAAVQALINIYRVRGHLMAHLDPLRQSAPSLHPELDPLTYGLTVFDLERHFIGLTGETEMPLGRILGTLRDAYCRTVGIQYMHIQDPVQKRWIQEHVEGVPSTVTPDEQRHVLQRLNAAEAFERFLHTRYVGQKRFGLEGAESAIPLIDAILDEAAGDGLEEAVLGMAHRGRLNVLANIVGKSYGEIFAEFEGNLDPETVQGSGDVKYHKGASGKFVGQSGLEMAVSLASNPSHLEAVDPVVEGMARARQDQHPNFGSFPVLPLLIHGDAAFAGQGVVAETLELSQLHGYKTGGTVHLVINNQLGFTTPMAAARSSVYSTDVALTVQAPIFHVNGDDPEACVRVARLAVAFRQAFHKDVVIDLVCYRRHGHNEGDDPSYTQPLMYREIDQHRSVRKLYTESLVKRGDITIEEAEEALADFSKRLQQALDETRASAPPHLERLPRQAPPAVPPLSGIHTGVERARLDEIARVLHETPEGFTLHPKLARQLDQRAQMYESGHVDWALAEALSMGALLAEGIDCRVAGQDTRRGTFSQRHAVLVDYETGAEYMPLLAVSSLPDLAGGGGGKFLMYDTLLSEYAALGFEYGYSVEMTRGLVAWEAQFGDFVNGAQIIIDNFIAAAGEKWGQQSALVLLLPHGFEGQGPEHSSARLERFLQLCAGGNMTVAQPTTSAQYFHLLRAQVLRGTRRPLIVMTPKWLLRARESRSGIDELVDGGWQPVIDDPGTEPGAGLTPEEVRRLLLCTGKVAFDALGRRDEIAAEVAVVRLEQLYPWPERELAEVIARYPNLAEVVWFQEEPENMGTWSYALGLLPKLVPAGAALSVVSRPRAGSPATGSSIVHQLELGDILDRAVGRPPEPEAKG